MEKNKQNRGYYYGIISGYASNELEQKIMLYMSIYRRNKPEQRLSYGIKKEHLYTVLSNLPIFRNDGTLDLTSLEGMPVYLRTRKLNNKEFIRKINFDLDYYGLNR